jgi:hypothetical protein
MQEVSFRVATAIALSYDEVMYASCRSLALLYTNLRALHPRCLVPGRKSLMWRSTPQLVEDLHTSGTSEIVTGVYACF